MPEKRKWLWLLWLLMLVSAGAALAAGLVYGGGVRAAFLVGRTTDGHHQLELACESCHTRPFGGAAALQEGCLNCHGEELKVSDDSHPIKKFTDPRNADRLEALDVTLCVTCHREHQPELTGVMGVTVPRDVCIACHETVGDDRPSHAGVAFDTCGSAGCHKFHDNRALYEDFLEAHAADPDFAKEMKVKLVGWTDDDAPAPKKALTRVDADAPAALANDSAAVDAWAATSHARAGVNCSGCHRIDAEWIAKPTIAQCKVCHAGPAETFVMGKHGMRQHPRLVHGKGDPFGLIAPGSFAPMTPAGARLPMKADAHDRALSCNQCHGAHAFDARAAAVEACAGCHDDRHTQAYFQSPHARLWQAEKNGTAPRGSGVSCATCHMPRELARNADGLRYLRVNHNQNDNLRPAEKMIRSVCLDCHGLGFTFDALADRRLIDSNFTGRPSLHVDSIDWVVRRVRARTGARK